MLTGGNCAPASLLQFLKKHVTVLSQDPEDVTEVNLHVLTDEYEHKSEAKLESYKDYSPKQFNKEYLSRKHLILVYQGSQIVLGMTAFEYAYKSSGSSQHSSRAYIQYVDTTGLFTPRQGQSLLTKSLLRAYLNYCKTILNVGSIHLLSSAKPAFLFAGSEFIEGKRALPAVKLINWWISLLQNYTADSQAKVFVYSPTEESEGSNRMKKRISSINSNWVYGFPYASAMPCVDQIPLFEDDPKWRHFQATILEEESEKKQKKRAKIQDDAIAIRSLTNVKEFFESIQIRPEFRADPSAFFVLQFPKQYRDTITEDIDKPAIKSDLATFGIKMLGSLTFESENAAKISSQKVASWMKLMAVPSFEVTRCENDKENTVNAVNIASSIDDKPKAVLSLQSLIKKKPQLHK